MSTPSCGNDAHPRPVPAAARLTWPSGRYKPVLACRTDLRYTLLDSLIDGDSVLVEPVEGVQP